MSTSICLSTPWTHKLGEDKHGLDHISPEVLNIFHTDNLKFGKLPNLAAAVQTLVLIRRIGNRTKKKGKSKVVIRNDSSDFRLRRGRVDHVLLGRHVLE